MFWGSVYGLELGWERGLCGFDGGRGSGFFLGFRGRVFVGSFSRI